MKSYKRVEIYLCDKCSIEVNGFDHSCDICDPKGESFGEKHYCRECLDKTFRSVDIRFGNEELYFRICEDCFKKTEVAGMIKSMFKLFRDIKLEWTE